MIFYLSHLPGDSTPELGAVPDWAAHIVLYGVLGVALTWGRVRSADRPGWYALGAFGLLWAVSDEWHQSFVPGRHPSVSDVVADVVGLFLGAVAATLLLRLLPPTSPPRPSGTPAQPIDQTS